MKKILISILFATMGVSIWANPVDTTKQSSYRPIPLEKIPWVQDIRILADITLSTSQDYLSVYDSSALAWKKIKVSAFLSGTSAVSGTTNRVAKFTSSTSVGNSSTTDDGSIVTTTVSGQTAYRAIGGLHSYISATSPNGSGNSGFLFENSSDANNGYSMRREADGKFFFARASDYPYSTEVDTINTYDPATGTFNFQVTNLQLNGVSVSSTNKVTKGGDTDAAALRIGTNDGNNLEFETNNTLRLRIVNSTGALDLQSNDIDNVDSIYALNPRFFSGPAQEYHTYTTSSTLNRKMAHYIDGTADVTMTVDANLPDRSMFFVKNLDAAFKVTIAAGGAGTMNGNVIIYPGETGTFQKHGTVIERLDENSDGLYTPTLTNVSNISASTAYECQWSKTGNTVTVSGKVDIDATTTAATELGLSLPLASNFTQEQKCAGSASSAAVATIPVAIKADTANDRASFNFTATSLTNDSYFFSFTYRIQQ